MVLIACTMMGALLGLFFSYSTAASYRVPLTVQASAETDARYMSSDTYVSVMNYSVNGIIHTEPVKVTSETKKGDTFPVPLDPESLLPTTSGAFGLFDLFILTSMIALLGLAFGGLVSMLTDVFVTSRR